MSTVAIITLISRSLRYEEETSEDQERLLKRVLQDMVSGDHALRSWRLEHVKVLEDAEIL